MSSSESEPEEPKENQTVVPSPSSLLDSIFRSDGPMPTASIRLRGLAFLLDFILISAVGSVIIWKIALPQSHPAALTEYLEFSRQLFEWLQAMSDSPEAPMPTPSNSLAEAIGIANELQMLCFWLYFAIGEAFFKGCSLGKRICRIRSVSTVTLGHLPIMAGIVRGGLKTLTLYLFFPIGMFATLMALRFNKRKQMGHDMLSRTAVIDEKFVNLQQPS